MAYRYKHLALDITELHNHVPGKPTIEVVSTPVTIDVTVDEKSKQDLDDYLTVKGWQFVGVVE